MNAIVEFMTSDAPATPLQAAIAIAVFVTVTVVNLFIAVKLSK